MGNQSQFLMPKDELHRTKLHVSDSCVTSDCYIKAKIKTTPGTFRRRRQTSSSLHSEGSLLNSLSQFCKSVGNYWLGSILMVYYIFFTRKTLKRMLTEMGEEDMGQFVRLLSLVTVENNKFG